MIIRNLLCLCGERQRGKDFLTQHLIKTVGAKRLSFSDEVRNLAHTLHPWFDAFDEYHKDKVYPAPENVLGLTGRDILLSAGRVRDVDPAWFVKRFVASQLPQVIANPNRLHVITDFRTPDEYSGFLQPNGIPIMKITRDVEIEPHPFEEWIRNFNAPFNFHNDQDDTNNLTNFMESISQLRERGLLNFKEF